MKEWRSRLKLAVGMLVASWAFWGPSAAAQTPSEVGQWGPLVTWPISATHTHMLPTGKVFFFGEFDEGFWPQLWDPVTGTLTELTPPHYNVFCSGHSFLADGRLLITGGHVDSHVGEPHATLFNPFTSAWEHAPDMNDRRWYPTNTTLPNGDVIVLSGETVDSGASNELPQRWDAASGTWRNLSTAMRDLPYYPRMFVAPNGKLLYVGPGRTSRYLDPEGTGTWFEFVNANYSDSRTYGGAVMFDNKILLVGGGDPPTNTVELLDLNNPMPTWQPMAPMSAARRHHNTTLLPDGTVLATGGSSGAGFNNATAAVKYAEVWNPTTNTWTTLATGAAFRGYHSTTVLLPDGRVLSAGGRQVHTAQVFSPPYLFKGARPTMGSAPDVLTPGTRFFVSTPDTAEIQKVTLIAMGSTTHAFDQNQRLVTLTFAQSEGGLSVSAPASNIAAPPGPYMLFLVNAQGVPSVAKIVRVEAVTPKGVRIINFSDVWKYDASNVDRGTAWLARDYDDSAWPSGPGQLGYGDEDEGTVLTRTSPAQPSVYFRKKFTLDAPITAARLEALHDDGVQVWINGVPVFSKYMAGGVGFSTFASASTSNEYSRATLTLSPNPFVVGENVITAMVKQVSGSSDDLTFALGLEVEKLDVQSSDSVHVVAPNGGEVLQAGSMATVSWICTGDEGLVDLSYSKDLGATWLPIASGVSSSAGSYSWMVPDVRSTQALVRVSKVGGQKDESDAPFSIIREERLQPITFSSVWKYQDNGLDPGTSWNQPSFDDSAWRSGAGQLGYGDLDEATVLTRLSPSQTSVYFRKKITLPSMVMSASMRVLFDDGLVVYVNGVQVFSRNVNNTAHAKYATESTENQLETLDLTLSPNPFVVGENTISAMVKQVGATSPDLSFALSLDVGVMSETKH